MPLCGADNGQNGPSAQLKDDQHEQADETHPDHHSTDSTIDRVLHGGQVLDAQRGHEDVSSNASQQISFLMLLIY